MYFCTDWTKILLPLFLIALSAVCFGVSPGDPGCFKAQEKSGSCSPHKSGYQDAVNHSQDISDKLISDPSFQHDQENKFFWNFLKDQYAQTGCELNMLNSLSLLPGQGSCPGENTRYFPNGARRDDWIENPKISRDAYTFQKNILGHIWDSLPELVKRDLACKQAKVYLADLKSNEQRIARGRPSIVASDIEDKISEEKKVATESCDSFKLAYDKIWSGDSPTMHDFIDGWMERYKKDKPNRKTFFDETLPVNEKTGELTKAGDFNYKKTFDGGVLSKMACEAKNRKKLLGAHMSRDGQTPLPGTFVQDPKVGQDIKEILMKDGGIAAFSFMERENVTKGDYAGITNQLQCHLQKVYYDTPITGHKVEMVVVGGVTIAVTAGAAVGVEGLVILGTTVDLATAAQAIDTARKTCGESMYALGSLQTKPMCELFQGKDKEVPSNITTQLDSRECNGAVAEALITGAGTTIGLAALKKANDAKKLEDLGQEATTVEATTTRAEPLTQESSTHSPEVEFSSPENTVQQDLSPKLENSKPPEISAESPNNPAPKKETLYTSKPKKPGSREERLAQYNKDKAREEESEKLKPKRTSTAPPEPEIKSQPPLQLKISPKKIIIADDVEKAVENNKLPIGVIKKFNKVRQAVEEGRFDDVRTPGLRDELLVESRYRIDNCRSMRLDEGFRLIYCEKIPGTIEFRSIGKDDYKH